ncbi:MAG: hypothetical protein U5M51_15495 [Emticicia sp.]|nr:hypothetical protein [Emticicia sp.]
MKKVSLIIVIVLLPILSIAHGYWLEVQGSGKVNEPAKIQIFYGEFENQRRETGKLLDKMSEIKIFILDVQGNKTEILMSQTNTHWEGVFTPKIVGFYQIIGINDTREVQDFTKHNLGIIRPVQYLRTNYQVGELADEQTAANALDILLKQSGENLMLSIWKENEAFAKTKVKIINPEGWVKEKMTNENGKIQIKTNMKGLYLVELEYIDKTAGSFKGKPYETVRYRCETTLKVQ